MIPKEASFVEIDSEAFLFFYILFYGPHELFTYSHTVAFYQEKTPLVTMICTEAHYPSSVNSTVAATCMPSYSHKGCRD